MTNTETTTAPVTSVTGTSAGAPDPRPAFAQAIALAGTTIAAVRADQMGMPTPCPEFDVRELTGHMLFALRRIAAVGRGETDASEGYVVRGIDDAAWTAEWDEVARQAVDAFVDDSILDRMLVLPFATLPGRIAASIYVSEMTTHTWDLARATGQRPVFDDAVVGLALATMQIALPAEIRADDEVPFGPVVPVADDAPAIDRLVAWVGRAPAA